MKPEPNKFYYIRLAYAVKIVRCEAVSSIGGVMQIFDEDGSKSFLWDIYNSAIIAEVPLDKLPDELKPKAVCKSWWKRWFCAESP